MYFSNSCVNQELVLKRKKLSEGPGTVQPDQNPTHHSLWLEPSELLFRDTLIFPLTIHRCLRRNQATKNTVSCISPCISMGLRGFVQQIRSLETQTRTLHLLFSSRLPILPKQTLPASRKLYQLIFRFIRRKDQVFFLQYCHPEGAYIKTQLQFFRVSESKSCVFPVPFSFVQKVRNILVLIQISAFELVPLLQRMFPARTEPLCVCCMCKCMVCLYFGIWISPQQCCCLAKSDMTQD